VKGRHKVKKPRRKEMYGEVFHIVYDEVEWQLWYNGMYVAGKNYTDRFNRERAKYVESCIKKNEAEMLMAAKKFMESDKSFNAKIIQKPNITYEKKTKGK